VRHVKEKKNSSPSAVPDVFSLFVFEVRAEAILPKLQMLGELEDDEDTMVHLEEGSDDEGELAPAELGGPKRSGDDRDDFDLPEREKRRDKAFNARRDAAPRAKKEGAVIKKKKVKQVEF